MRDTGEGGGGQSGVEQVFGEAGGYGRDHEGVRGGGGAAGAFWSDGRRGGGDAGDEEENRRRVKCRWWVAVGRFLELAGCSGWNGRGGIVLSNSW